jgi:uncharacterized protein
MDTKLFITPDDFLRDSVKLAYQIKESNFNPSFLIGIWRGGSFPGCVVQEMLEYYGIKTQHYPIKTSRFDSGSNSSDDGNILVEVFGLEAIADRLSKNDRVLIVDDVFDKGLSVKAVMEILQKYDIDSSQVKIASVFYKPTKNISGLKPDFYIHETDKWLVFPHEVIGIDKNELLKHRGSWLKEYL